MLPFFTLFMFRQETVDQETRNKIATFVVIDPTKQGQKVIDFHRVIEKNVGGSFFSFCRSSETEGGVTNYQLFYQLPGKLSI